MKRKMLLMLALVLAATIALSACAPRQAGDGAPTPIPGEAQDDTAAAGYAVPEILTDADWLNDNLDNVVVLDARDEAAYKQNHIRGAIHVTWQQFTDMEAKKPGDKGWGILLPAERLGEAIAKLGIDDTKTVVVYSDSPAGWGADGRVAWTLRMAGLTNVKLLNGSFAAWTAKGYPVDSEIPAPQPTDFTVTAMNENLNASTEYISENLNNLKLLDTREADEFNGATKFGEARGGHLPGAINFSWTQVFNQDGTIKTQSELEALFSSLGINKEDEIVSYCTKGIRSAHLTLVLRLAGYENARNYDASIYEWAGNKDLPLDK